MNTRAAVAAAAAAARPEIHEDTVRRANKEATERAVYTLRFQRTTPNVATEFAIEISNMLLQCIPAPRRSYDMSEALKTVCVSLKHLCRVAQVSLANVCAVISTELERSRAELTEEEMETCVAKVYEAWPSIVTRHCQKNKTQ